MFHANLKLCMLRVIRLLDLFLVLGTVAFSWNEVVCSFQWTHWLQLWAQLQRCEVQQSIIVEACRKPENATMRLFASFGWPIFFL